MTYQEIRNTMDRSKGSHIKSSMVVADYGRFSVMTSDKTPAIIIDSEVADKVSCRKWCIDSAGYPVTNVSGTLVRLYDYVMAQRHEEKPAGCYVDHINHDKCDNRIRNLRFVTPTESSKNMPLKSNNTSGYTGVSKTKYGTYRAYITVNKKRLDLGQYKTITGAIEARREAEDRFGFETRPGTIRALCEMEKDDGREAKGGPA